MYITRRATAMETTGREKVSIMKACELAGVTRRTIYNWLDNGKVEDIRTAGGSVRIFTDTLFRDEQNRPLPQK